MGDFHSQLTREWGPQAAGESGVEGLRACCQRPGKSLGVSAPASCCTVPRGAKKALTGGCKHTWRLAPDPHPQSQLGPQTSHGGPLGSSPSPVQPVSSQCALRVEVGENTGSLGMEREGCLPFCPSQPVSLMGCWVSEMRVSVIIAPRQECQGSSSCLSSGAVLPLPPGAESLPNRPSGGDRLKVLYRHQV